MLQMELEVEDHEVLALQSSSSCKARINHNPQRSMMKIAREMDVDEKTMSNVIKTDLKLSPLKLRTCQHLTDLQKGKRLTRAKILLNKLKDGTDTSEVIF